MKTEIRQRIEQIRRGEIPAGYKKTKAGIVPLEWKESRFKFLFNRINRKNNEGNTNVLTISAQHGLINQEDFFHKTIASDDKSNYFLLYRGDFAYNKSYSSGYPFGALKRLDRYDKGIVSPLYICFSANKENKCPDFYLHYFESGKLNSEIQAVAQEGARNHGLLNISIDDFFNSVILVPPLHEQQRIVEILSTQDKVIELYEKKIEQLQLLKKVCLQKMFPKQGSNVPEVRFPDFTEPWEQRKLEEEISSVDTGKSKYVASNSGKYEILGSTSVIGYDNTYDYEGNFLLTARVGANAGQLYRHSGKVKITDNTVFIQGNQLDFIYCALIHFDLHKLSFGTGQPLVKASELKKLILSIPCAQSEKEQIGSFFQTFDHLITLHQRQLDEEKRKKKALMQLLLTGIMRVEI